MFTFESHPIYIGKILSSGWDLYKSSLLAICIWSFILALIYVIPPIFGFIGIYHIHIADSHQASYSWIGLLVFLILLMVSTYFQAMLLNNMYQRATLNKIDLKSSFQLVSKEIFPLYIAMLAYNIVVSIGIVLLLLPGIYAWVLLSMFFPILIFEGGSVLDSFKKSINMVWGSWWQTFFALLIPAFIAYFLRNLFHYSPLSDYWFFGLNIFTITLIVPYFYAVVLVQYNNLKVKMQLPQPPSHQSRVQS
jgi:hypothetical protein